MTANRLGLIARADHRGLATMTGNVWRNMTPVRTLVVDMGAHSPYPCDPEQYPDRWGVVGYDELRGGGYDWSAFLDGLDVVYTAEIPYDFGLFTEAAKRGVKSVLHVMPELDPYVREPGLPRPDVIALPTCWMADRYPDAVLLSVPVEPPTVQAGDFVLHPAGHPATRDRNGTRVVLEASNLAAANWVVRAQQPPDQPWHAARVEVGDVADAAAVLAGAAVVVLPRRYGGLSLPLQEAMGAGLPVIGTDVDPYGDELHPFGCLPVSSTNRFEAKGGTITMHHVDPRDLAAVVSAVTGSLSLRAEMAAHSTSWATRHSWDALRPTWEALLGD